MLNHKGMMNENEKFDTWLREKVNNVPVPNPDDFWPGTQSALSNSFSWKTLIGGLGVFLILGGLTFAFWPNNELTSTNTDSQNVNKERKNDDFKNNSSNIIDNQLANEQNLNTKKIEEFTLANSNSNGADLERNNEEVLSHESDQIIEAPILTSNAGATSPISISPTQDGSQIKETTSNQYHQLALNESQQPAQTALFVEDVDNNDQELSVIAARGEENDLAETPQSASSDQAELELGEEMNESVVSLIDEEDNSTERVLVALDVEEQEEEKESIVPELKKLASKPRFGSFTQVQVGYFSDFRPTYGFELGLSYDFNENWGIQGGLGIQMVDRVGFSTSLSRVDYSFDRLDETYQMDMHNLLYASLPVSVFYRKNRHAFHTGVVLHLAIQARASVTHPDGNESSSWGNPNPAEIWQTSLLFEYRYAINEKWQIGLRYHWNNGKMIMGENDFSAFHIQLVKWW
jgi:hypothetical protein